jgi:PKD repeat protein
MSRATRRRRWRIVVAASTAFALAGVVVAISVAGKAGHAAANPASARVYVAANGNGGQVASYSLGGVVQGQGPSTFIPAGGSVDSVGINVTASTALVGFSVFSNSGESFGAEAVNLATNGVSNPVGLSGVPTGLAMDPVDPNLAYVLEAVPAPNNPVGVARIDQINLAFNPPTDRPWITTWPGGALPTARSIAISPNGSTLYVGVANGELALIYSAPLGNGQARPATASIGVWNEKVVSRIEPGVNDLAVAPDGSVVFATMSGLNGNLTFGITPLLTGLLPPTGQKWTNTTIAGAGPLTVSPDGQTLYVADNSSPGILSLSAQNGLLTRGKPAAVPDGLDIQGIAISPDGATMIVVVSNNDGTSAVYPVQLSTFTFLSPAASSDFGGTASPQAVVITPDQAPPLGFSASVKPAGQPTSFVASALPAEFGPATGFAWTFGDGGTGSGANASHVYAAAGTYTVTLTETDAFGFSASPTFVVDGPGQTPYWRADPQTAHPISVPAGPSTTTATTIPSTTIPSTTTTGPGQPTTTTTVPGQPAPGTPTLILNPAVGTPGTIVTVTGTGFVPNAPVTVSWTVSTGSVVIVADSNGNLPPSQLLILTPDVLGRRFAQASSTPQATAPFLVVPSTSEPGGDDAGLLFRSEGP